MVTSPSEETTMVDSISQPQDPATISPDTNAPDMPTLRSRSNSPQLTDALEAMLGGPTQSPDSSLSNLTKNEPDSTVATDVSTLIQPDINAPSASPIVSTESNVEIEVTETHDTQPNVQPFASPEPDVAPTTKQDVVLNTDATATTSSSPSKDINTGTQNVTVANQVENEAVTSGSQEGVKLQGSDSPSEPIILPSGKIYTPNTSANTNQTQNGEDYVIQPEQPGSDNEDDENPGWEVDSSPYESASDDSGEESDEDDVARDYPLLSPQAQARLLMDAIKDVEPLAKSSDDSSSSSDSDDDDDKTDVLSEDEEGTATKSQPLKTKNEKPETAIPLPDIKVTSDMKIVALGKVEHIVDNNVLIRGYQSGWESVLDLDSVLCLSDRSVIGAIVDVVGNVKTPVYSVLFNNRESITAANIEIGIEVFYVAAHSKHAVTSNLKRKGYDASNIHDEEVDENELDFSDDEKEAEHKRQMKLAKRSRAREGYAVNGVPVTDHRGRGGMRGGFRGRANGRRGRGGLPQQQFTGVLKYDDDDEDGPYRPLTRPASLANPGGSIELPQERTDFSNRRRPSGGRGDRNDRGRGGRRGDRNHGNGGNGRGRGRDSSPSHGGALNNRLQGNGDRQYNNRSSEYQYPSFTPQGTLRPYDYSGQQSHSAYAQNQGHNNQYPQQLSGGTTLPPPPQPPQLNQGPALPGQFPTWPQLPPPPPLPQHGAQLPNSFLQDPRMQQALQLIQQVQRNQSSVNGGHPSHPPIPPNNISGPTNHNSTQFQPPPQQNRGYQNNQSNNNGYYAGNNNPRGGYNY